MSAQRLLSLLLLLATSVEAKTVTYAISIGNNSPPTHEESGLEQLRFADDDAVRFAAFFNRFADRHWLLSILDAQTQQRYPEATARALPPTLHSLRGLIDELARRLKEDAARGDESVLYLTYSGHGAQRTDGTPFLAMTDGELTAQVLYEELLPKLAAAKVHLFIDACHAQAVVGSRGLFNHERDAKVTRLERAEVESVLDSTGLRKFPQVGAILATTEDEESHEWAQIQAGIFTHEVLSGLSGAADVNGDGLIEYSELQAFIASANRDIKNPQAALRVVASAPAINPRTPLLRLEKLSGVAFLDDSLASLGHFHIELDDGERYLDAHLSDDARARIALPVGRRVHVMTEAQEADLEVESGKRYRLAALRFHPRSSQSRGSIESSFRTALFRSPYGPSYYLGFADSARLVPVTFGATPTGVSARASNEVKPLPVTFLAAGGASLVASAVFGGLMLEARSAYDNTTLQRPAIEAAQRFTLYRGLTIGTGVAAAAFLVTGWWLWPSGSEKGVVLAPILSSDGAGAAVAGRF